MKRLLVKILIFTDRHILSFIKIKEVLPNEKTTKSLNYLNQIVDEANSRGTQFWITGSWAITVLSGKYFKQIDDIDLTTINSELTKLAELLLHLKYKQGISKLPDIYFFEKDGIEVEYFSAEHNKRLFPNFKLEDRVVDFEEHSYRILSPKTLYEKYISMFLSKKRNAKEDLVKLKILNSLNKSCIQQREQT